MPGQRNVALTVAGVLLGLALAPAVRAQEGIWPPPLPKGWREASLLLVQAEMAPCYGDTWLGLRVYKLIEERYPGLPHAEVAADKVHRLRWSMRPFAGPFGGPFWYLAIEESPLPQLEEGENWWDVVPGPQQEPIWSCDLAVDDASMSGAVLREALLRAEALEDSLAPWVTRDTAAREKQAKALLALGDSYRDAGRCDAAFAVFDHARRWFPGGVLARKARARMRYVVRGTWARRGWVRKEVDDGELGLCTLGTAWGELFDHLARTRPAWAFLHLGCTFDTEDFWVAVQEPTRPEYVLLGEGPGDAGLTGIVVLHKPPRALAPPMPDLGGLPEVPGEEALVFRPSRVGNAENNWLRLPATLEDVERFAREDAERAVRGGPY